MITSKFYLNLMKNLCGHLSVTFFSTVPFVNVIKVIPYVKECRKID